jgi:hypothetical protein
MQSVEAGSQQNRGSFIFCLLYAGFLLGLLFNLENGGGMIFRNVS